MKELGLVSSLLVPLIAFSQPKSIIKGRILGADGRPMPCAHAHIDGGLGHFDPVLGLHDVNYSRVQANPDGSFEVSTNLLGALCLVLTGVGHQMMQIPLAIEKPVNLRIEVRLSGLRYSDDLSNVEVAYDFEDIARGKRSAMKRQSDGTFLAQVPTDKKEFKYRLLNIGGSGPIEGVTGTTAHAYEYFDEGVYTSILRPSKGIARIIFDPSKLQRSNSPQEFSFGDPNSVQGRFAQRHRQFTDALQSYQMGQQDHLSNGRNLKTFSFDWSGVVKDIHRSLKAEGSPLLRDQLVMQYLELARMAAEGIDTTFLRAQISEVSPTSLAWVYYGSVALNSKSFHPLAEGYLNRILEEHPSRSFRAMLLFRLCSSAKYEGRVNESTKLFYRLVNEYGDTPAGTEAKSVLRPNTKIHPGTSIPEFSFSSVQDSSIGYTKQTFAGKYFLLDFWATWCSPCVKEMEFLHKAYEKFRTQNFEILSVSFDWSVDHVKKFQATRWRMPWRNAFVDRENQDDVSFTFDVALPKPILIDPSGKVLETDQSLRGKNLDKTLSRYLGTGN